MTGQKAMIGILCSPPAGYCTIHVTPRIRASRTFPKCRVQKIASQSYAAGPADPPPDYSSVDRNPINKAILQEFRTQIVKELGRDTDVEG